MATKVTLMGGPLDGLTIEGIEVTHLCIRTEMDGLIRYEHDMTKVDPEDEEDQEYLLIPSQDHEQFDFELLE